MTDAILYSHCKIGTTHYYIRKSRGKISPKGWGAELRNVGMCCIIESYHESYRKFLLHVHMVLNACGLNAFAVNDSGSRYSSGSWSHLYPQPPRPAHWSPPAKPGLSREGQCPAQPQNWVIKGGPWFSTLFWTQSSDPWDRLDWEARDRWRMFWEAMQPDKVSESGHRGNAHGVRSSPITFVVESCITKPKCTYKHPSYCGILKKPVFDSFFFSVMGDCFDQFQVKKYK